MMDNAFFFLIFILSSTYFTVYGGVQYFSKDPEGSNIFQAGGGGGGGSNFFQGRGVLIIISKETHITCDFLGGGPYPPLWIRTCKISI